MPDDSEEKKKDGDEAEKRKSNDNSKESSISSNNNSRKKKHGHRGRKSKSKSDSKSKSSGSHADKTSPKTKTAASEKTTKTEPSDRDQERKTKSREDSERLTIDDFAGSRGGPGAGAGEKKRSSKSSTAKEKKKGFSLLSNRDGKKSKGNESSRTSSTNDDKSTKKTKDKEGGGGGDKVEEEDDEQLTEFDPTQWINVPGYAEYMEKKISDASTDSKVSSKSGELQTSLTGFLDELGAEAAPGSALLAPIAPASQKALERKAYLEKTPWVMIIFRIVVGVCIVLAFCCMLIAARFKGFGKSVCGMGPIWTAILLPFLPFLINMGLAFFFYQKFHIDPQTRDWIKKWKIGPVLLDHGSATTMFFMGLISLYYSFIDTTKYASAGAATECDKALMEQVKGEWITAGLLSLGSAGLLWVIVARYVNGFVNILNHNGTFPRVQSIVTVKQF